MGNRGAEKALVGNKSSRKKVIRNRILANLRGNVHITASPCIMARSFVFLRRRLVFKFSLLCSLLLRVS